MPGPATEPWETPSSALQRTALAVVAVSTTNDAELPLVITATVGSNFVILGPRPPDGFTISSVWVTERGRPRSSQLTWKVTRRKSSPSGSTFAVAAPRGQYPSGAVVVATPSTGSS